MQRRPAREVMPAKRHAPMLGSSAAAARRSHSSVIGEKSVVNANVETVDAIILGHYDGNMTATGNVEIAATGRVSGNTKTDSLVISKGGCFSGNVTKINEDPAATHRPLYLIEDKLAGQIGPR